MKSVLIIGLGRFGKYMAENMMALGNEVLAIDNREERVNEVLETVTNAQIGDATSEAFIASLGVRNFDICVVAIGDNFQSSLETTSLLKDYGAGFVLARANRDVHAKFLLRNGADRIAYPEKEMAERLAMKYGTNNIFDYVELTHDYSIYEIAVPEGWVGKSILEKRVRTKYHISILATYQGEDLRPLRPADHIFNRAETLIIVGHHKDVRALIR